MNGRAFFQYGVLLPRSPFDHVDRSIGKKIAWSGTSFGISWIDETSSQVYVSFAGYCE